jgi:hypothetical protein
LGVTEVLAKLAPPTCELAFDFAAVSLAGEIVLLLPGFAYQFLEWRVCPVVGKNPIIGERRSGRRRRDCALLSERES